MTQEEYLLDTLEYYSVDPINRRCISESIEIGCRYSPVTIKKEGLSEGCGIGRKLSPEAALEWDKLGTTTIYRIFLRPEMKVLAPEWMQEMDVDFLSDIQRLHDVSYNWCDKGLSNYGKASLVSIIISYELNKELFSKYL